MENKLLNINDFEEVLKALNIPKVSNIDFLYKIYESVVDGIYTLMSSISSYKFVPVNHYEVILYIVNEYIFSTNGMQQDRIEELKNDEDLSSALASICCDKYFTNEQLSYNSPTFLNKFNPSISTMNLYLNFNLTKNIICIKNKSSHLK